MKKKILVVDDEPTVTSLVAAMLTSTHLFDVDTTNNASEAFEWAFSREYDLLITDVRMPLLDGDQLYKSVAELSEYSPHQMKVLLMSGALDEVELAQRAGSIFYIQKPFPTEDLLAKVQLILESDAPAWLPAMADPRAA